MAIGHDNMTQTREVDSPPSYDFATESQQQYRPDSKDTQKPGALNAKGPQSPGPATPSSPFMIAGPAYIPQSQCLSSPIVYHYTNPRTGEHVTSLLPPDHPEMICLQAGEHMLETRFGFLGILAAIFWFPLGVGLCLLDRRVRCTRCGHMTDDGLCG